MRSGACSATPTSCTACTRPCSSVISTSRPCTRCWMKSARSVACSRRSPRRHARMAELREQQFTLARHVRDPSRNAPPPGIEERRIAIYRDLFYNSIESLLAGNFPVIRKTLGDARWKALVRNFYASHRCRTPLFTEIGREFIQFLEQRDLEQHAQADMPPWLHELAHYEWVELALQIADDELPPHDPDGDLLAGKPVPSPLAWALAYCWPVSRIGPDYQPDATPDA